MEPYSAEAWSNRPGRYNWVTASMPASVTLKRTAPGSTALRSEVPRGSASTDGRNDSHATAIPALSRSRLTSTLRSATPMVVPTTMPHLLPPADLGLLRTALVAAEQASVMDADHRPRERLDHPDRV